MNGRRPPEQDPRRSLGEVAERTERAVDDLMTAAAVRIRDRIRLLDDGAPMNTAKAVRARQIVADELRKVYGTRRGSPSPLRQTIEQQAREAEQVAVDPVVRRIHRALDTAPELRKRLGLPDAID